MPPALQHIFRATPTESLFLLGLSALGGLAPVAVLGLTRLLVNNLQPIWEAAPLLQPPLAPGRAGLGL
ncbi:hypothetical protein QT17_00880 [Thermus sp. 2.9]|nr:hypothetical protein QT17_00880 [Thermus sp. 2.9]